MSKFPSQEMDRFNVRLPAGMRDAIAERAKANGRSMNSEIVQILQDALEGRSSPISSDDEIGKMYAVAMSINPMDMSSRDCSEKNKMLEYLIDAFMQRIGEDTQRFQSIMRLRSQLAEFINKKPT